MAAVIDEATPRPLPMTERLADALRRGDADAFAAESPAAACLFPLLNALGWRRFDRSLVEALPHFADSFDVVDLRNLLATLGYESRALKTRAGGINPQLLPCLFESSSGRLYVLLEPTDRGVRVYDAQTRVEREASRRELHGTAYVVTDTQPSHGVGERDADRLTGLY